MCFNGGLLGGPTCGLDEFMIIIWIINCFKAWQLPSFHGSRQEVVYMRPNSGDLRNF